MKNIATVMRKEFARFFGDKRMIVTILLPAILIYFVYSFMGTALANMLAPDEDHDLRIYAVNMPASIMRLMQSTSLDIRHIEAHEVADVKERITQKDADLCIVFPRDFDAQVEAYDVQTSAGPAPNIEIYFNSTDTNSSDIYRRIYAMLDAYEASLANKFDVNREIVDADRATAEDVSASFISSMMPMLLMIFLFSGCMGLALESITGEKERGTIATLLVTPLKRSELAIGKILSLAVLSFLSGLVTAVATILSLPNLMTGADSTISAAIYSATDYTLLAFVILSTLLLLVTAISIVSAFAKTVKEASAAVMPLMIVVMLVSVTGMFSRGAPTDPIYYIIPLYGSVQSMSGIFSLDYSTLNIVLSCLSSLVCACIGSFALTKMFNSEKVMFSR
jgi:sodium transport system permease protein